MGKNPLKVEHGNGCCAADRHEAIEDRLALGSIVRNFSDEQGGSGAGSRSRFTQLREETEECLLRKGCQPRVLERGWCQ